MPGPIGWGLARRGAARRGAARPPGRGRWKGDAAFTHQRAGMAESMGASGPVGDVATMDIESILAGYAQAA